MWKVNPNENWLELGTGMGRFHSQIELWSFESIHNYYNNSLNNGILLKVITYLSYQRPIKINYVLYGVWDEYFEHSLYINHVNDKSTRAYLTKAYDVTIQRYHNSRAKIQGSQMHILQGIGSKFCVKFQRCPLKFHTKFWTHTPQNMHFTRW